MLTHPSPTIVFPKLTPTHLDQLRVLYKKRPDPAEGIITFWANRLGADREEVKAWIEYQQEKAKAEAAEEATGTGSSMSPMTPYPTPHFPYPGASYPGPSRGPSEALAGTSVSPTVAQVPRAHLPTPAKSASPSRSPEMRMPSLPPIAVKVEAGEGGSEVTSPALVSELGSPMLPRGMVVPSQRGPPVFGRYPAGAVGGAGDDVLMGASPFTRANVSGWTPRCGQDLQLQHPPAPRLGTPPAPKPKPKPTPTDLLFEALRTCQKDSANADASGSGGEPPRTLDELEERFKPFERRIDSFVGRVERGELVRFGWDPSSG
ncbi:hypothetical protein HYDPIDRAFT_151809 [Hydnomerulius pinastri MD-312]|nr:hypothetical protein HYDPIDRAFT_151809 [Hydnomerulius pinastri MD-312]